MKSNELIELMPEIERLYKIEPNGLIVSLRKKKFLKPDISTGYARVTLYLKDRKIKESIHRLVCAKYIPNPDLKPCVNHKDGNKLNNQTKNLEWCTYKENEGHSYRSLGKTRKHSEETKEKLRRASIGRDMTNVIRASLISRGHLTGEELKTKE